MDRAFVQCCARHFTLAARDWNVAFQTAWSLDDGTFSLATQRQHELQRVTKAFEAEVLRDIERIATEDAEAPRALPNYPQVYLKGNIFYRILPDARSARQQLSSLRGVLQSRCELLTVPLSCTVMYQGLFFLAQALIPLAAEPVKLAGHNAPVSDEIVSEVTFLAAAANVVPPPHPVCEVYEGLDGRYYVTLTNVTIMPTSAVPDTSRLTRSADGDSDAALCRAELLALCPDTTSPTEAVASTLRQPTMGNALRVIGESVLSAQTSNVSRAQSQLCALLHLHGVNLRDLPKVFWACGAHEGQPCDDGESGWRAELQTVIALEMIARTAKEHFYLEIQARQSRLPRDIALQRCLGRCLQAALHVAINDNFEMQLSNKYRLTSPENEAMCSDVLLAEVERVRRQCGNRIVERVSTLLGVRVTNATPAATRRVVWLPMLRGSVLPRLCDPQVALAVAAHVRGQVMRRSYFLACCLPRRILVALWQKRFGDALSDAEELQRQLAADTCSNSTIRILYAQRIFCRLLLSVRSIENVREACERIMPMLDGFYATTGYLTRVRCHLDVGSWLLGVCPVVNVADEAYRHFQMASKLMPASLRSAHGAWLYLQPSMYMLRCRQTGLLQYTVPLQSFVVDALYLARVATASDALLAYLWELGEELEVEALHEDAARVLTAATKMRRELPGSSLDARALRQRLLEIYRRWDPDSYAAYCDAIEAL